MPLTLQRGNASWRAVERELGLAELPFAKLPAKLRELKLCGFGAFSFVRADEQARVSRSPAIKAVKAVPASAQAVCLFMNQFQAACMLPGSPC